MAVIEIKVPDIGDYSDVPVIEVLVAVGDSVVKDQGLVTLESDKATLEVPSSAAGVVKELKVKVGDSLSEGALVLLLEAEGEAAAPAAPAKADSKPAPAAAAPAAAPGSKPPVTPSHRAPAEPAPSSRRWPAASRPISNARWWCSAPALAATPPRSVPPTWAWIRC